MHDNMRYARQPQLDDILSNPDRWAKFTKEQLRSRRMDDRRAMWWDKNRNYIGVVLRRSKTSTGEVANFSYDLSTHEYLLHVERRRMAMCFVGTTEEFQTRSPIIHCLDVRHVDDLLAGVAPLQGRDGEYWWLNEWLESTTSTFRLLEEDPPF